MEAIMANLPPDMPLDSAMILQSMQRISNVPEQFRTIPMRMEFSGHKSLMTPDLSSLSTGMSPFGGDMPLQLAYIDHMEGTTITRMPSFDETAYLISQKIKPLDWSLIDTDSTILDYPVKKAEFSSDTLNVIAWYSPEIPSMVGPMQFGGLPGLPLLMKINMESPEGLAMSYNFVALRLEEGLEKKITPPEGTLVTPEEYLKIMSEKLNALR